MVEKSEWTTIDFDTTSWHDCHIYGFKLEERGQRIIELVFDIDFIVEWLCGTNRRGQCRVAPATLTFHDVAGLQFDLDYPAVSAGMQPFSIAGIQREEFQYRNGQSSFRWRLPINWPSGVIEFASPGFRQVLRRAPILVDGQALTAGEREGA